jgi:hypothetical protein
MVINTTFILVLTMAVYDNIPACSVTGYHKR